MVLGTSEWLSQKAPVISKRTHKLWEACATSSLCPQLLPLASVPTPVRAAQGASLLTPHQATRTWVFPTVSFAVAATVQPWQVPVRTVCPQAPAPADVAASCSRPETGGPELAYSGDTHTPSLSSPSVTSPCSEFWDTEVIWLFLNVFCFWTENNFADVPFGGKREREREFQTKPRMI